jgi:hypothetical protein
MHCHLVRRSSAFNSNLYLQLDLIEGSLFGTYIKTLITRKRSNSLQSHGTVAAPARASFHQRGHG